MSAARLKALEAVARMAFARADEALHNAVALWGSRCTDCSQRAWLQSVGEAREALGNLRAALDALPPPDPEPAGEVVEVRAVVFRDRENGEISVYAEPDAENVSPRYLERIAIITARVPIPTIPTIPATVEPGA